MANNDRVQAAADQLYAADPAEFTDRRSDLVAQARADGDQAAARATGAGPRPPRAAVGGNPLPRADPDAGARRGGLGDELRAAESALDGGKLRELSQTRRKLLGDLTRQALDGAGVTDPPDALQQEVTGTLSAALADPEVAARVGQAQLAKSVQPAGFGFGLANAEEADDDNDAEPSAPPAPSPRPRGAGQKGAGQKGAGQKGTGQTRAEAKRAAQEQADRERAAREQAERERQRRAIDEAEQTLAEADRVADSAQTAEADRAYTVRQLEEQLEDAQDALADAKRRSREARTAQRQARKALEWLRERAGS